MAFLNALQIQAKFLGRFPPLTPPPGSEYSAGPAFGDTSDTGSPPSGDLGGPGDPLGDPLATPRCPQRSPRSAQRRPQSRQVPPGTP